MSDDSKTIKWMTKEEIVEELTAMADRLESIKTECDWSLKGYAGGAADLAAQAVFHLIDLVQVATPMYPTQGGFVVGGMRCGIAKASDDEAETRSQQ